MFCNQCEQTSSGGCRGKAGICGKSEDIASLQDSLIFGLKGLAAYAYHAGELGARDSDMDAFMHEALFATLTNVDFDMGRHVDLLMRLGQMNLRAMELLNNANTGRFGNPTPVAVSTGTKAGPGIVVTGHDLLDLYELLKQTEGTGVNIYTHSEMLPAHGYPELRKFKHLVANYGNAWFKQKVEFNDFPGAMLATTNCVLIPDESYRDRLFTCGIAGVEGVTHIKDRNFKPVIDKALSLPPLTETPGGTLMTGFHSTAVLGLAGPIIEAIKAGKIKHFFLVGGCDAPGHGGDYYRKFVEMAPKDTVILTLACGKYRFNDLDLGEIDGIPRLVDIGQCNDAYSAIQIAAALADAFECSVNDLPLSLVLSWFEQKAIAILFTLLSLGIKGIRVGPKPPAWITPNVFQVLQDSFDLKLTTTPEADMKAILTA